MEGDPPQARTALRVRRIVAALCLLLLAGYLSLATALWAYYSYYRRIPGVEWVDVAVLPRFSRVQTAIGDHYFEQAKQQWKDRKFVPAIFTARAAVNKSPRNLEARLFLGECWRDVGRPAEAVRILRDGLQTNASDARLQKALVATCIAAGRFKDLLEILRKDLPAKGVRLLEGTDPYYRLAEIKAVVETAGPAEADRTAAQRPGLAELPEAAPLLARIDWDLGRVDAAFAILAAARARQPGDSALQDTYIDMALRAGKRDEAIAAAESFLAASPGLDVAQLRFLEAHGLRRESERRQWTEICIRYMLEFRHNAEAMSRLANLASSQGWSDVAYLLYQNSLEESLNGFPFAIYYVGSLVREGSFAEADDVWHQLTVSNPTQLAQASYLGAMVASGAGRESEALQILQQIRQETETDPARRLKLVEFFREFGFGKLADQLANPAS